MGLQNQLSDVSSESFIVIIAVILGKGVGYLNSLLFTILQTLRLLSPVPPDQPDRSSLLYDVVGSGLASVILLCEQLNMNRACSYSNRLEGGDRFGPDCIVCLNRLGEGDHVRRLPCRHVFHMECFDGWLEHLNFSCPICRAPLVSEERVELTQRNVAGDLLAWFPFQY